MSENTTTPKNGTGGDIPVPETPTPAPEVPPMPAAPAAPVTPAANDGNNSEVIELLLKYGLSQDQIATANAKLDELGVETVSDLSAVTALELGELGIKTVKARRLLEDLQKAAEAMPNANGGAGVNQQLTGQSAGTLLTVIPADEAWLSNMKAGGILKVGSDVYIAATRAAIASKAGIYDVPKVLVGAMEEYALQNDEPVADTFYALSRQLTQRSYGELFAAIPGVNGNFVSDKRKKELVTRVEKHVWPAVGATWRVLSNWHRAWVASVSGPAAFGMLVGQNNACGPMPSMTPPDTAVLRNAADDLRNAINAALAGTGKVVASAMAYDFMQIKRVLSDQSLPATIGAANREQMFKKLGLAVSSNLIDAEANITNYVINFARVGQQVGGIEVYFYDQLYQLGLSIDWSQLGIVADTTPSQPGFESIAGNRL